MILFLVLCGAVLFWALAVIVEERFVPSLGVICETCKIPSDVAGATLMAAGASSPELFSSLVALFVTHSALGVGTVVGSEIFNHLMICAGSVAYARGSVLTLDRAIVARESVFYGLALVLLLVATGRERTPDGRHIVIHWDDGLVMLCVYICYVLVCAKFESLVSMSEEYTQKEQVGMLLREPSKNFEEEEEDHTTQYQAISHEESSSINDQGTKIFDWASKPALRQIFSSIDQAHDDIENKSFSTADSAQALGSKPKNENVPDEEKELSSRQDSQSVPKSEIRPRRRSFQIQLSHSMRRLSKPAAKLVHNLDLFGTHRELHEIESPPGRFACYLFRYNKFHAYARFSSNTWDLRWCVLIDDVNEFRSFRARDDENTVSFWSREYGARKYKLLDLRELDKERGLLQITIIAKDQPQNYPAAFSKIHNQLFLAPCASVYNAFVERAISVIAMSDQEDSSTTSIIAAPVPPPPDMIVDRPSSSQQLHDRTSNDKKSLHSMTSIDLEQIPRQQQRRPSVSSIISEVAQGDEGAYDDESSFIAWPDRHASLTTKFFHILLFPAKFAFHISIRSVQGLDTPSFADAAISCIQCVFWLAILSFCMCACCEKLGELVGLSDATIGITFSAVGTSLPNLFASMTSARKGWGNAAVSNALGSNTFNILLGLGFPWFLFCITHGGVYIELPADNVVLPICVLAAVLAGFLILLKFTQFKLYRIHAIVFVFLYIAFLFWNLTLPSND